MTRLIIKAYQIKQNNDFQPTNLTPNAKKLYDAFSKLAHDKVVETTIENVSARLDFKGMEFDSAILELLNKNYACRTNLRGTAKNAYEFFADCNSLVQVPQNSPEALAHVMEKMKNPKCTKQLRYSDWDYEKDLF